MTLRISSDENTVVDNKNEVLSFPARNASFLTCIHYLYNKCPKMEETNWNIFQKLRNLKEAEFDFAILILNQPILSEPELVVPLWRKAALRVLVDGGSNRWLKFLEESKITDIELPDFISGDFDSVRATTWKYFESRKVEFICTPDQDATDFTKALRCAANVLESKNQNVEIVIVICENSGCFDKSMSNVNTIHRSNQIFQDVPVILLSSQSITWVLHPGKKHNIFVAEEFVTKQYSCGLIPFCGPTRVSTTGLKWNLENDRMEMGGLVSTSNTYVATEISITCDRSLVWTTQYCDVSE